MKIGIISDVHGNIRALKEVFKRLDDCDEIVNLGDSVNYGPASDECVDFLESEPRVVNLQGNHERDFIKGFSSSKSPLAGKFFKTTFPRFSGSLKVKRWFAQYERDGYLFTHTLGDRYVYPETEIDIDVNSVIGHSHLQFMRCINGKCLINPGSVGQNRANMAIAQFAILRTSSKSVEFHGVTYDLWSMLSEMKSLGYDDSLINYYVERIK
jgi:putative phosphoesterase